MKLKESHRKIWRAVILSLTTAALFALFLYIFYSQIVQPNGRYDSDIQTHIKFALNGTGYSLLYRIMGLLHHVTRSPISIAVMEALMVVGTWLLSSKWLKDMYRERSYTYYSIVSLPAITLAGIYVPWLYECFYKYQLVTQPYHNITFIGMRFFAVPVMLIAFKVFEQYLQTIRWKQWVLLAVALVVSTAVKPSFFYGFALSLLIMLIVDFIRTKFEREPFKKMVLLGLVVVPSLCVMAFQALVLFGEPSQGSSGSGIALIWGARFIKKGFLKTFLKVFCGMAFPLLVAIMDRKQFKRTEKFTYLMYAIQLFVCMMFTETGKRARHGNFFWGLYGAAFFMFLIAFARYIDDLRHYRERNKVYLIAGGVLCVAHVLSGAFYFWAILNGGHYYR